VAATNRNLDEMVAKGEFREDLLFRLRSFIIELPPLRQRLKDIKNLALFHTSRLCERYKIGPKGFAPEFLEALMAYSWPGNVRELVNALDQALTVARHEPTLFPKHLPFKVRVEVVRAAITKANQNGNDPKEGTISDGRLPDLQEFRQKAIDEAEKQYLRELMPLAKGNVKEACRLANLSKSRLYGLLKKYDIS
jgi:two-component system, NtrC family, response regulator